MIALAGKRTDDPPAAPANRTCRLVTKQWPRGDWVRKELGIDHSPNFRRCFVRRPYFADVPGVGRVRIEVLAKRDGSYVVAISRKAEAELDTAGPLRVPDAVLAEAEAGVLDGL